MTSSNPEQIRAAVIGAGPAGLAAAEALCDRGAAPVLFDAMPSPARKFLMAGKSGLNLTKDEPVSRIIDAIGCPDLAPILTNYSADEIKEWATGLGEPLFTGSSGRVFPKAMKASPLLRRWLGRLTDCGTTLRRRWRWTGWQDGALSFDTPDGPKLVQADVVILALGGGSWPRLGSDAAWVPILQQARVDITPLCAANMGFNVAWSTRFADRFHGAPVKSVALRVGEHVHRGEFVITRSGVEGGGIYGVSASLRNDLAADNPAGLMLDLFPDQDDESIAKRLARPRGKNSRSNHLRKAVRLQGVRAALVRELAPDLPDDPDRAARILKNLRVPVTAARPIAEAISSAGGVSWSAVTKGLELKTHQGVFVAGEMLDWEAPTGGYLLTGCLATGRHAGRAAAENLGI